MSATDTTPEDQIAAGLADDESQATPESDDTGAEETPEVTPTDTDGGESNGEEVPAPGPEATEDENLQWLKSKGIEPDDPEFKSKVAKAYRESEKAMHATNQQAKSIQQAVAEDENVQAITEEAGADPDTLQMKRDLTELRFFQDHSDEITKANRSQVQDEIKAVARDFPKLAADFDLETMYAIAESRRKPGTDAIAEAKRQGREEAKAELAKASVATVPKGNASGPQPPKTKDEIADVLSSND